MFKHKQKCLIVTAFAMVAGQAGAQAPSELFMRLGDRAPPPLGYLRFCARVPDQCGLAIKADAARVEQRIRDLNSAYYWTAVFDSGAPEDAGRSPTAEQVESRGANPGTAAMEAKLENGLRPLEANSDLLSQLSRTNQAINRSIHYVSDRILFGDEDYWHLPLERAGPPAGDCKDYVLEKRRALISEGIPVADLSIAIVRTWWGQTHAVLLVTTDRGELVLDSLNSTVMPWQTTNYRWIERQAPGEQLNWVRVDHAPAQSKRTHSRETELTLLAFK